MMCTCLVELHVHLQEPKAVRVEIICVHLHRYHCHMSCIYVCHACTARHDKILSIGRTVQHRCAAGTAKGPMPAMTSQTTSPSWKVSTSLLCSCSSLEFQYTCATEREQVRAYIAPRRSVHSLECL